MKKFILTSLFLLLSTACAQYPTLHDDGEVVFEDGAFLNQGLMISGKTGKIKLLMESNSNNCDIVMLTPVSQRHYSDVSLEPMYINNEMPIGEDDTELDIVVKCRPAITNLDPNGQQRSGETDFDKITTKITVKYLVD